MEGSSTSLLIAYRWARLFELVQGCITNCESRSILHEIAGLAESRSLESTARYSPPKKTFPVACWNMKLLDTTAPIMSLYEHSVPAMIRFTIPITYSIWPSPIPSIYGHKAFTSNRLAQRALSTWRPIANGTVGCLNFRLRMGSP